jgi:polyhydroxyalkanoate synthesis repressor PhaR
MAKTKRGQGEPTIIKKYANRRLYDTGRSSYVTLEDLGEMIREGHDFKVLDAKSGDDITRSVLAQIIVDKESENGEDGGLLPLGFMKNLIGFYGDKMQGLVPNYLENTFDIFVKNQERMREQINQSLGGMTNMKGIFPGASMLEEINRQNMAMLERTMQMFTPFGKTSSGSAKDEKDSAKKDA